LKKKDNLELIKEAFQVVTGQKLQVKFVITQAEEKAHASPTPAGEDASELPEIITQALDIFEGAKILKKE